VPLRACRFSRAARSRCTLASGVAAAFGDDLFGGVPPDAVAFVLAFAAGAILTMLADTMMPEAYAQGGGAVGLLTTLGFAVAFGISSPA
jgi:zinc transporter, ZIP family